MVITVFNGAIWVIVSVKYTSIGAESFMGKNKKLNNNHETAAEPIPIKI